MSLDTRARPASIDGSPGSLLTAAVGISESDRLTDQFIAGEEEFIRAIGRGRSRDGKIPRCRELKNPVLSRGGLPIARSKRIGTIKRKTI